VKLEDVEKEFDEQFKEEIEQVIAEGSTWGEALVDEIKHFYWIRMKKYALDLINEERKRLIGEILTDLYTIRASIPLTFAGKSRELARDLLKKLEKFRKESMKKPSKKTLKRRNREAITD